MHCSKKNAWSDNCIKCCSVVKKKTKTRDCMATTNYCYVKIMITDSDDLFVNFCLLYKNMIS